MEDLIYHLIFHHYNSENAGKMQELQEQIWDLILESSEAGGLLRYQCTDEGRTLCNNLRIISLRLDAAIAFAKNYFKLD
jgi:hypothetical protein